MSNRFTAWLHVTPSPSTLAESSAVYHALSKHGRISAFIRSKKPREGLKNELNSSSSTFYTVFPHEPPTLQRTFNVPVYHDLPSARDEDPFNIRGLQNRKPMPAPKTFTCVLEPATRSEVRSQQEAMIKENPYHGHFKVKKDHWSQTVLNETNAPPGVAKGCAARVDGDDVNNSAVHESEKSDLPARFPKPRKINMRSLMEMWQEANGSAVKKRQQTKGLHEEDKVPEGSSDSAGRLSADKPIGMFNSRM